MRVWCQYHPNALARVRDEQVQQLTATVEDFYKSVQQCLRHIAGLPIRPARERLFGLVLGVATKRAQEEQQVWLRGRSVLAVVPMLTAAGACGCRWRVSSQVLLQQLHDLSESTPMLDALSLNVILKARAAQHV